ncbi:MAG: AcrR family transcriptional regulator [Hyphomicrobiaceae bacterium]|jgi:AcrR family transcriptional regulator
MAAEETKNRILDAAERLFAQRGFAATSLRTIISEAGVNLAAVHYHFGSKEALIGAVFVRRFGPINQERIARLDELEKTCAGVVQLPEIIQAFVSPAVRIATAEPDGGATLLRLIGRVHTELGSSARQILRKELGEVVDRFEASLQRALPELGRAELALRFRFVVAAMATALAAHADPEAVPGFERRDLNELVAMVATFTAAGMLAPAGLKGPVAGDEQ